MTKSEVATLMLGLSKRLRKECEIACPGGSDLDSLETRAKMSASHRKKAPGTQMKLAI